MCVLVAMDVTQWEATITTTTIHTIPLIMVNLTWTFIQQNPFDQSLRHGRSVLALEVPILMKEMVSLAGNSDLGRDDPQKPFLVLLLGHRTDKSFFFHRYLCNLVCFILIYLSSLTTTIQ